jgi:membrane-anchored mycosin MYCP
VWVAAGGLGGALLLAGLVFGGAVLMKRTGRQE